MLAIATFFAHSAHAQFMRVSLHDILSGRLIVHKR
jgi:hypothetical protein